MTYEKIQIAKADGLATLTLNAPDRLNAVSRKMIGELKQCWEDLATDSSVRAVLLTGAGRGFCAGADLADPDRAKGNTSDSGEALDKFFDLNEASDFTGVAGGDECLHGIGLGCLRRKPSPSGESARCSDGANNCDTQH